MFFIRSRNPKRKKSKPANEISQADIESLLDAIRNHEGYPRLKDLRELAPLLSAAQLEAAVRYLEKSGQIVLDADGSIIWTRHERMGRLTLAEKANISDECGNYAQGSDK